jgi:hypothetical protein
MIPRPIYELLPYLYFSIGLAAAMNIDPIFGQLSGALLSLMGYRIWRLRKSYRKGWE